MLYPVFSGYLVGLLLIIANIATILYALYKYRIYKRLQLASYEMINRSFDQMQRAQLTKMKILEPIILSSDDSMNNGPNPKSEPITVINIAVMENQIKSKQSIQSANSQNNERIKNKIPKVKSGKSSFWFRNKPTDHNNCDKHVKSNSFKISFAKRDMTI